MPGSVEQLKLPVAKVDDIAVLDQLCRGGGEDVVLVVFLEFYFKNFLPPQPPSFSLNLRSRAQLCTRLNRRCNEPKKFAKIATESVLPAICACEGMKLTHCNWTFQKIVYHFFPESIDKGMLNLI